MVNVIVGFTLKNKYVKLETFMFPANCGLAILQRLVKTTEVFELIQASRDYLRFHCGLASHGN